MRLRGVAFLLAVSIPVPAGAQVVKTPDGTVEFVGLKRWTVQMIRDTMAAKAPGQPLGECAGVLKAVGFASASSRWFTDQGAPYIVVAVVEPEDSGRVRPRSAIRDSLPDRPEWRAATAIFRASNRAFQAAVSGDASGGFGGRTASRGDSGLGRMEAPAVARMHRFLRLHRREADYRRATWTLSNDANLANAAVAAAILGGFGGRDRAWRTLLEAQLDRRAAVAVTASQVLVSLARSAPRRIDWAPARSSVRSMLEGTNVFLFTETMDVLRATGISRDLAPALLRDGGGDLLLAHLGAHHPGTRESAHAFLVQLAGTDHGPDPAAWARWVASLD